VGDVAQVADLVKSLRNKKRVEKRKVLKEGSLRRKLSRQHGFTLLSIHPLTIPRL
jgi:hypothetical protein